MSDKLTMAVDLLWVKHNKVGGVEAYIRNLLDGLMLSDYVFDIYLITAKDNFSTFNKYTKDNRFKLIKTDVESLNVPSRIMWQNIHLGKLLKKYHINTCFEPHNYIPTFGVSKIKFITTIHDLQLAHYPENFDKKKVIWFKYNWKNTLKNAKAIVAISEFVKSDIYKYYPGYLNKINVIYNPITIDVNDCVDFRVIHNKYNVEDKKFYFTVSSLLPHKNLSTLIKVFSKIKNENISLPQKLIISGVGGKLKDQFEIELESLGLKENVIITGFVDNNIRNALYKHCRAFLFPSVFEGFGMPPIEAMLMGTGVITTRESCLPEVTQNKCSYVNDPYNVDNWIDAMEKNVSIPTDFDFERYSLKSITNRYFELFMHVFEN